jgi:Mn2+/Fe2+ NRAMP family transporter
MSGSVAHLPGRGGGGDLPPEAVYGAAVEEYRFQARYNWSRTQYHLGFNVAILAAATAVATRPEGHAAALVFFLGIVAAGLSASVVHTQHDYYRAARNHMARVEDDLGVPLRQRLDTTASMGTRRRKVSVNQLVYFLLAVIALADAIGAVLSFLR